MMTTAEHYATATELMNLVNSVYVSKEAAGGMSAADSRGLSLLITRAQVHATLALYVPDPDSMHVEVEHTFKHTEPEDGAGEA